MKSSTKRLILYIYDILVGCGAIILIILGCRYGAVASDIGLTFWSVAWVYFVIAVCGILFTAIINVVIFCLIEMVDNVEELNLRLARSKEFQFYENEDKDNLH